MTVLFLLTAFVEGGGYKQHYASILLSVDAGKIYFVCMFNLSV